MSTKIIPLKFGEPLFLAQTHAMLKANKRHRVRQFFGIAITAFSLGYVALSIYSASQPPLSTCAPTLRGQY